MHLLCWPPTYIYLDATYDCNNGLLLHGENQCMKRLLTLGAPKPSCSSFSISFYQVVTKLIFRSDGLSTLLMCFKQKKYMSVPIYLQPYLYFKNLNSSLEIK